MDIQQDNTEPKRNFFSELVYRRVPHVLGLYMAGSWTFLEFSEAIFSRLNLSPYWSDVSLMTVLIMFPTVLLLAYRHGAPGHQNWTHKEKIGIPANILGLIAIIFMFFSGKDLGYRAEMVETISPDGTVMQLMVPKQEFKKRIYVGFFRVRSENIDPLMALGVPTAIELDLHQNSFINSVGPMNFIRPIKEAGFSDTNIPLALMLRTAKNKQFEFVITGDIQTDNNNNYIINASIYESKDGSLLEKIVVQESSDLFTAVDRLTPEIINAIGLGDSAMAEQVDLPIEERLTSNSEAYLAFLQANIYLFLQDKFIESESEFKRAISLDASFAMASAAYANNLLFQSRIPEGLQYLKLAKQHDYRFDLNQKFYLTTIDSVYSGDFEKAQSILEQWLVIEPNSTDAWEMKANYHTRMGQRELAIEANQKLLELDPYGTNRILQIGRLYSSMGYLEEAIEYYERFISVTPNDASAHLLLGDAYRSQGKLELSTEQYTQAQVLFGNNNIADRRIAENLKRVGKFEEAEAAYLRLIEESITGQTKYEVMRELATLFMETGRSLQALDYLEEGYDLLKQHAPEGTLLQIQLQDAWQFSRAGESARGLALINQAKDKVDIYDNALFRSNILISEAMFTVFDNPADFPLQKIDEAQQNVNAFLGDGQDHIFVLLRGIANHFIGQHKKATDYLSDFLSDYPTFDIGVWLVLASSHLSLGDTEEASVILATLLKEYPSYPDALLQLGKVHIQTGEFESAKTAFQEALLGWLQAQPGHKATEEAMQLLAQLE